MKNVTRKGWTGILLATCILAGSLTGCGAEESDATEQIAPEEAADYAPDAMGEKDLVSMEALDGEMRQAGYGEAVSGASGNASGGTVLDPETATPESAPSASEKKLIKDITIEAETTEYEKQLAFAQNKVTELGGYIESITSNEIDGSKLRNTYLTARIPYDKVDQFKDAVEETVNITYSMENVQDVTLQYVDLASHKKTLEAEQQRLLELMERAETIDEIISIEDRLTELRYQIESMESQLRTMDNQVSYSTVNMTLTEVEEYEPEEEPSVWERIQKGFEKNVRRVIEGLKEFVIGVAISIPFFLLIIGFGIIILGVVLLIVKLSNKKKHRPEGTKKNEG